MTDFNRLWVAKFLLLVALIQVSGLASAQWCPPGYLPIGGDQAGWKDCAPMIAPDQPAPDPGPEWATRWGAIAVDGKLGRFGGSENNSSKSKAKKAAAKECRKNGGKTCKIIATYYNQCGAMVSGAQYTVSYSGPEIDSAINKAMGDCSGKTSECKPFYAGCSYPLRIR